MMRFADDFHGSAWRELTPMKQALQLKARVEQITHGLKDFTSPVR